MTMRKLPGIERELSGYHDFEQQLKYANANTSCDQLQEFYTDFFPWLELVEKVSDIVLQRQGIDTVVTLKNGKQVYFDEKVRKIDYGDIFLEEFSVWQGYPRLNGVEVGCHDFPTGWKQAGLIPGWLNGSKATDYITYIVKPSSKVYFLPFLLLQSAWKRSYREWLATYGRRPVRNKDYYTTGIPIKSAVLYQAIYAARTARNLKELEEML